MARSARSAGYIRVDPRDARIKVTCESGRSSKCRGQYMASSRAEQKNRAANSGRFVCLPCSRFEKNSGRSNPNAKYLALDDRFFERIDSEGKAYLLGWIASDGSITAGSISIYVHEKDAPIVDVWNSILGAKLPVRRLRKLVGITINSQLIVRDVCRWLDVMPGKKSRTVGFPELPTDDLRWAFLRGFFDGDGSVSTPVQTRGPRCNI
ncbi:MAG TPA: hypothetical protein VLT45_01610, partial [Kofleriaceae bacterium]|nr:hypothetical protein [Kofleriaceae bacterium]